MLYQTPAAASLLANPTAVMKKWMSDMEDREELDLLESVGIDVLDPRSSHRQFRCRRCRATWRPARSSDNRLRREDWLCWRGCNSGELESR